LRDSVKSGVNFGAYHKFEQDQNTLDVICMFLKFGISVSVEEVIANKNVFNQYREPV
jgi:hypothetical protein